MSLPATAEMPPPQAAHCRQTSPSIPLSRLVEFAVQRAYHELEVLTNL